MAQQLHDLNFTEDFIEVVKIKLRLIYDLYGHLANELETTH